MRKVLVVVLVASVLTSVRAQQPLRQTDERVAKLIASVSEARIASLVRQLAGFGTRNTLSTSDTPNRGITAAGQWILDEMRASGPRLQVSFDSRRIEPNDRTVSITPARLTRSFELRNVVAVLPGRTARRIYVTAHYDSVNSGPDGVLGTIADSAQPPSANQEALSADLDAPGANDNASGTALVMELARVFANSGLEFDATLVFMATAGEEQGLVGARVHAQRAKSAGVPIQAVFNSDIVGGISDGRGMTDGASVRVYSEGPDDSPSRSLAQFTKRIAARYVPAHLARLFARRDRFSRGGDHNAFNLEGIAAVGFREARENFLHQHSTRDTVDSVSFAYIARNAQVNGAAVAVLALAPAPPESRTIVSDRCLIAARRGTTPD